MNAIRNSLIVLPANQTTVPFLIPGTSPENARRVVTTAGLNARFKKVSCYCLRA